MQVDRLRPGEEVRLGTRPRLSGGRLGYGLARDKRPPVAGLRVAPPQVALAALELVRGARRLHRSLLDGHADDLEPLNVVGVPAERTDHLDLLAVAAQVQCAV